MKIGLDLSNYVTKENLKNATDVDTSKFPRKVNLTNLKSEADKQDFDKLEKVPTSSNSLKSKLDELDIGKLKTNRC